MYTRDTQEPLATHGGVLLRQPLPVLLQQSCLPPPVIPAPRPRPGGCVGRIFPAKHNNKSNLIGAELYIYEDSDNFQPWE